MVSDKDIYRSAQQVIKKCGKAHDPIEYALFNLKSHLKKGDKEGGDTWRRIAYAIKEIQNTDPGGTVH